MCGLLKFQDRLGVIGQARLRCMRSRLQMNLDCGEKLVIHLLFAVSGLCKDIREGHLKSAPRINGLHVVIDLAKRGVLEKRIERLPAEN